MKQSYDLPAGAPITQGTMNGIIKEVQRTGSVQATYPLEVVNQGAGILLRYAAGAPVAIAEVLSPGITARSGTTPGSGSVALYDVVGGVLTATGELATAYYLGTNTSGVATNAWVTLAKAESGEWFVVSDGLPLLDHGYGVNHFSQLGRCYLT